jgi:GDP-D-mannose dehydratase
MSKKALITGVTGQDGSYLAEFLLKKVMKSTELKDGLLLLIRNA